MAPLVRFVLGLRRATKVAAPLGAAIGLGGLVVLDAQGPFPAPYAIAAGVGLLGLLASRGQRRARAIEGTILGDLELGALLVVLAMGAAEHLDGSLDGRAFPAVYVAVGLVSAFARPGASIGVLAFAALLESAIRVLAYGEITPVRSLPHLGFMLVFAALNLTFLRGEIVRIRRASRARLDAEIARLRDDARSYRLLGAPAGARPAGGAHRSCSVGTPARIVHRRVVATSSRSRSSWLTTSSAPR